MDLVSNKDFILEELESAAKVEIERMRQAFETERAALSKQASAKLDSELEQMRLDHHEEIERVKRSWASRESLEVSRITGEAFDELHARVESRILASARSGDSQGTIILERVVARMRSLEPVRIEGPSWSRLDGVEPVHGGFLVRAFFDDGSYDEVSEDDVLSLFEMRVREAIVSRWKA